MNKKLLGLSILSLSLLSSITLAGGSTIQAEKVEPSTIDRVPPVQTTVNYSFSETGVKELLNQTSTLLQVSCNSASILKSLGFDQTNKKIFNIGLENEGYEFTFDIRNCSLRGNKANYTYNYNKSLTEAQALDSADKFIKNTYLKDKLFYQLGKPIIIYKNANGGPYPLYKETSSARDTDFKGIEIDNSNEETIEPEYVSFSILYPYLINGKEVYEQYGNKAGITLEVNADGVTSINARLLQFKGISKKSEKITKDDAVRILKNGGNSPFRGQAQEIKFSKPEKVIVLFNLRRDNKSLLFMSSGIGLKSNVKTDQRAQQPYTMILSDYKIGNTAQ